MDNLCESEFADEYQDWLGGHPGAMRAPWFEVPLSQLQCGAPLMVAPTASLRRVIALMNEQHRGAALVVREQRLVGIFTERDAFTRVLPYLRSRAEPVLARSADGEHRRSSTEIDLDDTTVSSLMTPRPDSLPETATLAQALRMMVRSRYRHLPLLDACGRACALVSMHRIIEFVSDTFPKEILNAPPERQSAVPPLDGA